MRRTTPASNPTIVAETTMRARVLFECMAYLSPFGGRRPAVTGALCESALGSVMITRPPTRGVDISSAARASSRAPRLGSDGVVNRCPCSVPRGRPSRVGPHARAFASLRRRGGGGWAMSLSLVGAALRPVPLAGPSDVRSWFAERVSFVLPSAAEQLLDLWASEMTLGRSESVPQTSYGGPRDPHSFVQLGLREFRRMSSSRVGGG